MEDSKDGVLGLVGRVIKKRLGEFKEEASRELAEGAEDFKAELRRELDGTDGAAPAEAAAEVTGEADEPTRARIGADQG